MCFGSRVCRMLVQLCCAVEGAEGAAEDVAAMRRVRNE